MRMVCHLCQNFLNILSSMSKLSARIVTDATRGSWTLERRRRTWWLARSVAWSLMNYWKCQLRGGITVLNIKILQHCRGRTTTSSATRAPTARSRCPGSLSARLLTMRLSAFNVTPRGGDEQIYPMWIMCDTKRGGIRNRGRAQYEHNKERINVECWKGIKSVAYKVS